MPKKYFEGIPKLGGADVIVEVDESKFGKRKYNRGHSVDGIWVVGMVERTPQRRIILIPVEKRDAKALSKLLKQYIHSESIIYSDCWKGYSRLKDSFQKHLTVNHKLYLKDPVTEVHTNTIEGNWAPLKKYIPNCWKTNNNIWLGLLIAMKKKK